MVEEEKSHWLAGGQALRLQATGIQSARLQMPGKEEKQESAAHHKARLKSKAAAETAVVEEERSELLGQGRA